jgi:hypothetical protein
MTTKKETTTTWGVLSKIDCSDHVEQKGGLTYLSWAWAWKILKEHFPDASFEKHWFDYGDPTPYSLPYALDKQGMAFVKVTVTVAGAVVTEVMPVLDNRNRSVQRPNSFSVNTSLQRCLTKAIAYHGLGAYIYAGEDTPDVNEEAEEVLEEAPAIEATSEDAPNLSILEESPDKVITTTTKSLDEWRKAFIDAGTVTQTDEGVVVAYGKNLETWKLVVTCFEVFMPSIDDVWGDGKEKYENSAACVKTIEDFYRHNKKPIKTLGEEQPEMLKGLVKVFSDAKKAAKAGQPYARKEGVTTDAGET